MLIQVKGGTRAGFRIVRERPSWECLCVEELDDVRVTIAGVEDGYFLVPRKHQGRDYSCPDCGLRRPA